MSVCLLLQDQCLKAQNKLILSMAIKQLHCSILVVILVKGECLGSAEGWATQVTCLINRMWLPENGDSALVFMKNKQDQGKAFSLLTTSCSNYCMSFTASGWCGSDGLIWESWREPLSLSDYPGGCNAPLWISQGHFRQIQGFCLPWCHGRKRCLMHCRQFRAPRLLGSSRGPIYNNKIM